MNTPYDRITKSVQVNIPFTMLQDTYLDRFLKYRLNPEIGLDAYALDTFSSDKFKRMAMALRKHHPTITFHAPFIDLSPGSDDPAIRNITRRRFEQMLELIPVFEPITVVAHAGYDAKRYGFNQKAWIENSIETWSWLAQQLQAGTGNTRLMLENVYEHHPDDIKILLENLNSNAVGFCLDTGHITAFSRSSMAIWIETMKPFIRQIHLHDNHGGNDDHVGLGKGNIDFQPLVDYLKSQKNYPPVITLEPHTEKDLWDSLEFLDNIWPYQ
jgi:sugar phosphate isomerase/epimerase